MAESFLRRGGLPTVITVTDPSVWLLVDRRSGWMIGTVEVDVEIVVLGKK